jgi:Zn-dependent protease with chaperone function
MVVLLGIGLWPTTLAPLGRGYVLLCRWLLADVPVGHHYPPLLVAFLAPVVITLLAGCSIMVVGEILAQRRLARSLNARVWEEPSLRAAVVGLSSHPENVIVTRDREMYAFCCGFVRPRIYISRGILEALDSEELGALLRHELHHQHRRDPLRLFAAGLLRRCAPIFPVLESIGQWARCNVEVEADRAALANHPPAVLASAMVKVMRAAPAIDSRPIHAAFSPTDARIAALCGKPVRLDVSRADLLVSLLLLLECAVLAVWLATLSLSNPPACSVCPSF